MVGRSAVSGIRTARLGCTTLKLGVVQLASKRRTCLRQAGTRVAWVSNGAAYYWWMTPRGC
jgi:hypothetical protein